MQSSDLTRECEDLVAQIAALHTRPSTPTRVSAPPPISLPSTTHATANKPTLPRKSSRRFGYKTAPLVPTLSTLEVDPLSDPGTSVVVEEVRPARKNFQSIDAQLAQVAFPTPEAALRESPFSLPPPSAAPSRSRCDSQSGTYAKSRKRRRDGDETRDMVIQKEEPATEKASADDSSRLIIRIKPPTPRPSLSLSERFTLEIVPDEKHTSIWDDVLEIDDTYPWSGKLIISDRQPWTHSYTSSIFEDFSIQLDALLEPRSSPPAEASELAYTWQTNYSGYRVSSPASLCDTPSIKYDRGIALEKRMFVIEPDEPGEPRMWMKRFWVPIPLSLFARAEHRTFVCSARMTVEDAGMMGEIAAECVTVSIERLICKRLLAGLNTPKATT